MKMRARRRFLKNYVFVPPEITVEFFKKHLEKVLSAIESGKYTHVVVTQRGEKKFVIVSHQYYTQLVEVTGGV